MLRYTLWALMAICGSASAQQNKTIIYVSQVPLVIRTDHYIDSLGSGNSLQVVTPGLSVYLHPVDTALEGDEWFTPGDPLPVRVLKQLEYRIIDNLTVSEWKPIPTGGGNSVQSHGILLASRIIDEYDSLIFEFRRPRSTGVIQRTAFYRHVIQPRLKGFRVKSTTDSVDNKIKAKTSQKKLPEGFTKLNGTEIMLRAGENLDMIFERQSVNADSSLEYRYAENSLPDTAHWLPTGHQVSISRPKGNTRYFFEVRYASQSAVTAFTIITLPYWYQRLWCKIGIAILLLYLVTGLPYHLYHRRLKREREQRKNAEQRLRMVQNQLNPHFVFNALNTIDALLSCGENEKAAAYLQDFSGIMRETVRNSAMVFVSLEEDIGMLQQYLRIEQLRFGFSFAFHVDEGIDVTGTDFPPMLLQPLVENAVKHGVAGQGKDGKIELHYLRKGRHLVVRITDNGRGIKSSSDAGTGKGLPLTKERIENLSRLQKQPIGFSGITTEKGTITELIFENWLI